MVVHQTLTDLMAKGMVGAGVAGFGLGYIVAKLRERFRSSR